MIDKLKEFIKNETWTFAKTMASIPHWYVVSSKTKFPDAFKEFISYIDNNGYNAKFYKKTFKYLHIDDYKYWTDEGYAGTNVIILNRTIIKKDEDDGFL